MKEDIVKEIVLVEGVTAEAKKDLLKIKGPKGEVEREFISPRCTITLEANKIVIKASKATQREKKLIGSFAAHLKNMIKGVQEHYTYRLKICSGHFPMNVSISGEELLIKNFLGESVPRRVKLIKSVNVKIDGAEILISSSDKEAAGQMAGRIEQSCRITNRDRRIFQDGCYIIEKAGKSI